MPVSTDSGEPPAKCCKFCDESTPGVDGSVSWRLTLDQDLIDTLKGSFPNWFNASSASTTSINNHINLSNSNNNNCTTINNNNKPSTNSTTDKKTNSTTIKIMAEGERSGAPSANQAPPLVAFSDKKLGMGIDSRQSPPKAVVDSSPLQPQMDKNKESLKVKLMVRRSVNQLVEQGIMPPLKTSPALHEQRKQLQRAKTGDLLKAKIQSRPDRQELERRHILELQEGHIDPSLAEKRRMLEKALLADQLNSKISHRPGPLELIEKNILHTEEPIERIVKEGLVPFKAANEAIDGRPQHPDSYVTYEEDSQSSEGDLLPSPQSSSSGRTCDVLESATQSAGITVALTIPTSGGAVVVTSAPIQTKNFHATAAYIPEPPPPPPPPILQIKQEPILHLKPRSQHQQTTQNLYAELCQTTVSNHQTLLPLVQASSPSSLGSTTSSLSPLSSVASPPPPAALVTNIHSQQQIPQLRAVPAHLLTQTQHQFQKSDAPGKDKNRKKSKAKPMAKVRSIKFHEYKGPPNAQKSSSSNSLLPNGESNYQLIMKQQYLLEYLEGIYKHPPLLPASQKPGATATVVNSAATAAPILVSSSNSNVEMMTVQLQQQPVNAVMAAVAASTPIQMSSSVSTCSSIPPSPASTYSDSTAASELSRLNRMKVSDLKQHLKKLNLPVSGPKPQLIERLRPFLPLDGVSGVDTCTEESVSGDTEVLDNYNSPRHSMSPAESEDHESMDCRSSNVDSMDYNVATPCSQITEEDIVREQQKKIDELQRKLKQSQEELEQVKQKTIVSPSERSELVTQRLKQQLEARIQKEKLNQLQEQQNRLQKEHLAFQQAAKNQQQKLQQQQQQQQQHQQSLYLATAAAAPSNKSKPMNAFITTYPIKQEEDSKAGILQQPPQQLVTFFNNNQQIQLTNSIPTFVVVGLSGGSDGDKKLFNGHQRTSSLSGIVLPITTAAQKSKVPPPPPPPLIDANTKAIFQPHLVQQHHREAVQQAREQPTVMVQQTREQSSPPVAIVQPTQHQQHVVESQTPPPQYEEATKQLKNAKNLLKLTNGKPTQGRKGHMVSQDMTDVLEILIESGELPQSAVDPTTPTPQQSANLDSALKTMNKSRSRDLLFSATAAPAKDSGQHISYSDDIPSSLLLDAGSGVLDLNVLSPMQQDDEHHQYLSVDDAFKMISQATPPPPSLHSNLQQPPSPDEVDATVADIISLPSDDAVPILTDFNDLDLMEFQMDIEDESQQQSRNVTHQSFEQNNNNNNNSSRRDMNPSLQPSLNDIIQQQQQQQLQTLHHNGFSYSNNNNNNNLHDSYVDTPMDFENLLANFDSGLDSISSSNTTTGYDNILGSQQTTINSPQTNNYHHLHHSHHSHHPQSHLNYLNHHSPHSDNILDLFNEDYRMTLSDPMSCEVDNLLCNI